jgi:glyceraldehyde-3-phosphate dehydrogenase/erythrose-4-phosphate dehydrogenase
MSKVNFFDSINIAAPKQKIFSRLGARLGLTRISSKQASEIDEYIAEAQGIVKLKGAALRIPIQQKKEGKIVLATGIVFESISLYDFLKDAKDVLFIAATAGKEIVNAVAFDSQSNNLSRGVVFDAVASEMTDAALSWIMDYYSHELTRENRCLLSRRFSAGYGDFSLENQRIIYFALLLGHMGVTITNDNILVPEKSVTAVTGIK